MSKLSAEEKRQQQEAKWQLKNAKAVELFLFLQSLVQAVNSKVEDFELAGFSYTAPSDYKPIASLTFENSHHSRTVGIYGHDSDLDGRFYIHARAPRNVDVYIHHHQLTPDQARELKDKHDAAVTEQNLRREELKRGNEARVNRLT